MRKYANKIEETNRYGILYIPKLDSLSSPIYRIPSIWNPIPYPIRCSILLSIGYLYLIPIGSGLGRFPWGFFLYFPFYYELDDRG